MEKSTKAVSFRRQGGSWVECELTNTGVWDEEQMHYSYDGASQKKILDYAKKKYYEDLFYDYDIFVFFIEQPDGRQKTFTFEREEE